MDLEKVFKYKDELQNNMTFEEIVKCFREILYEPISYWDENHNGIIYDGTYNNAQIEQATRIQQRLSTCLDLYNQIISSHREFDESYLKDKNI